MNRVRVGQVFVYEPVMIDIIHPPYNLRKGDMVRVVKLPGCPPPNTMGHCHVVHDASGEFAGLVHVNSLVKR